MDEYIHTERQIHRQTHRDRVKCVTIHIGTQIDIHGQRKAVAWIDNCIDKDKIYGCIDK
jgi:hypothetical protein